MLTAQLLAEHGCMVPASAGGGVVRVGAGEAADQTEALGQSRWAGGLLLQQCQARFDHLALGKAERLAEVVEPGLAAVIEAHRDGPHGLLVSRNTQIIRSVIGLS